MVGEWSGGSAWKERWSTEYLIKQVKLEREFKECKGGMGLNSRNRVKQLEEIVKAKTLAPLENGQK